MKESLDLQKTIISGLQGLPDASLYEIAEYVLFVRQKALRPEQFQQQFEELLIEEELAVLESNEATHLEEELKDYQDIYPEDL